jgi:Fic family protein
MIEKAPKLKRNDIYKAFKIIDREDIKALVSKANEKYEYWSEIKYKTIPNDISHNDLWACVKLSRMNNKVFTWKDYGVNAPITNSMQRYCYEFDMNWGGSWGNDNVINDNNKQQYLISSIMEEAISSSQMEGAVTTRKIAKDMLMKQLSPKNKSEQMIYNNYKTIKFISSHKEDALTPELLLYIHSLMTDKTMKDKKDIGAFRKTNDVVVENGITHEVVHIPPSYTKIPKFVEDLCLFFNEDKDDIFIHPIIKGIIIHYMVAYVHPFVDGNGRTARALFYWYMLKRKYWLMEYLSISRIIYKSKVSYEKSFLYSEADDNDMGYFILYNMRVLSIAFNDLKNYIQNKIKDRANIANYLKIGNINQRQAEILEMLSQKNNYIITIKELENKFSISHTTAKQDIDVLLCEGLLEEIPLNKVKKGYIKGKKYDEIINNSI